MMQYLVQFFFNTSVGFIRGHSGRRLVFLVANGMGMSGPGYWHPYEG